MHHRTIRTDEATDKQTAKKKMKANTNIIAALTAIAAANPEGYTVDAHTLQPIAHGYAVAVAATQNSFGTEGLERVAAYIAEHQEVNAFGGWFDNETGRYYFDATVIFTDFESAAEFARANNQLAFFDLERCKEIRL